MVLGFDYIRGNFSDRWFAPQSPHDSEQAVEENRALVEAFCSQLSFRPDEGDPRRLDSHRHEVAVDVPLRDAYEGLLLGFKHTAPTDSLRYTGLLLLYLLVAVTLIIERLISLRRKLVIPESFLPGLKKILNGHAADTKRAIEYCNENGSPIANVFAAGLRKLDGSIEAVEKRIVEAGQRDPPHRR